MKTFVTGASGLVGSHLLVELVRQGKQVRALKHGEGSIAKARKTFSWYFDDAKEAFRSIEWVQGDILDYFSLEDALDDVDQVFHCAGMVSFVSSDEGRMMKINKQGTENLVNACLNAGVEKLCHVSSVAALGQPGPDEAISEKLLWKSSRQHSAYAKSKYAAEREVWRGIEEGLDAVVVNPTVILGPGNWINGSTKLFSAVYKGMPFYTQGVNGYVDVRDVVEIMIRLMDSPVKNERFLLNSEDLSYEVLLKEMAHALKVKVPFIPLQAWMGELGWRIFSILPTKGTYTRDTTRTAFNKRSHDGSKIRNLYDFHFIPVKESIGHTAGIFLAEKKTISRQ